MRRTLVMLHGFDVRRAVREFEAAGLAVIPAPIHVPNWTDLGLRDLLPDASAVVTSHYACYEVLALARDGRQRRQRPAVMRTPAVSPDASVRPTDRAER